MRISTLPPEFIKAARALADLERLVATVKGHGDESFRFKRVLDVLKLLSRKEDIPLAIIGGLAAIHHGFERFTKDIDLVARRRDLDVLVRVAPQYGIKVVWKDPHGWHKLHYEGVNIDVVPESGVPKKDAPTQIPAPKQLGVSAGAEYAALGGWVETKLSSYRVQDQADVVQVMKKASRASLAKARSHIAKVHAIYLQRFDELLATAEEEKEQERERGGPR